jgi:hypothetical protein
MTKAGSSFSTIIRNGFLFLILILASAELLIYILTPVYDFPEPVPFSGNKIFNPYKDMDSLNWKKANFHFHTKAWSGITSGRNNSNEKFWEIYKKLGYDIATISNYQSISRFNYDSSFYIPAYEHGFNATKTHQMCIGARKVLWLDYSLFQNLNTKQNMLNLLRGENEIVAVAHPDWGKGYSLHNMRYLSDYDLIEALDANWRSIPHWDVALSSGHPVYILGDDDAHDISNPYQVGRCCTFINSATTDPGDILTSLKQGNAFGADVYMYDKETFDDKARHAKQIPNLNRVKIVRDTLWVSVSQEAKKFLFIGQDGKVKKAVLNTSIAFCKINTDDTYIRTEIIFPTDFNGEGTKFYLNPVFRYSGGTPNNFLKASINYTRTWILRLLALPSLAFLFILAVRLGLRKKVQKQE